MSASIFGCGHEGVIAFAFDMRLCCNLLHSKKGHERLHRECIRCQIGGIALAVGIPTRIEAEASATSDCGKPSGNGARIHLHMAVECHGRYSQHRRCLLGKEFVLETVYVDYVALQAYVAAETVGIHHILHIARGLQGNTVIEFELGAVDCEISGCAQGVYVE